MIHFVQNLRVLRTMAGEGGMCSYQFRTVVSIAVVVLAAGAFSNSTRAGGVDRAFVWAPEPGAPFKLALPGEARPVLRGGGDLCDGFPVDLDSPGAGFPYTPTLFDADADGADEIFLTGGHTFGLRGDGTFLPGWPTGEMTYMGYGTNAQKPGPSVADMDGDGEGNAQILWSERDWYAGDSIMWSFNGKQFDGTDLPGFPQEAIDDFSNALDTPFVIGDVDGDGDLEAWGAHTLGNNFIHYRVSAFDHLGTRLFTVDLDPAENIISLYFGDLDGDGDDEMFAISWLDPDVRLHVFEPDGSEVTGYPIDLYTLASGYLPFGPPVPTDLDEDGDLEILIGRTGGGSSYVECRHHDGTPVTGFPIFIASSSQLFYIGLGDITGDGTPELLAFDNHLGSNYRVYALNIDSGAPLLGWPVPLPDWPKGFPTVVDVDGDGVQDICAATDGGELYAIDSSGAIIEGFPVAMASPSISGVAAGDIDGDGLFELVAATWDGLVYAWNTTGPALPESADWPMRGIDARNTGVFRGPVLCPADLNDDDMVNVFDLLDLLDAWGPCPGCAADLNGDDVVNVFDLLDLLDAWGPCE
jgi:hypothetical protein